MSGVADDVLELRPLTGGDLPAVERLERELFGPAAWSPAMLAEELHGPERTYLAAVERTPPGGTTLVGYAGLWFDGADAQVMTIGVAATRQGRGIGGRLLAALIDRARHLHADSVLLEVRVDNEPALALYRRFGFVTLGRRRGYYQPENADAWTMRLDLRTTVAAAAAQDVAGEGAR